MAQKTLPEKVDDLIIKVTKLETEFSMFKKISYIILAGIIGILAKLYWGVIISSPTIVANVIASLNNITSP